MSPESESEAHPISEAPPTSQASPPPVPPVPEPPPGSWRATVAGALVILALSAAWSVLSYQGLGTAGPDAVGEGFGVAFALLVVISVIGAVRNRTRGDRPRGRP